MNRYRLRITLIGFVALINWSIVAFSMKPEVNSVTVRLGNKIDNNSIILYFSKDQGKSLAVSMNDEISGTWEEALIRCEQKSTNLKWRLPTKAEISYIWANRFLMDRDDTNGGFSLGGYWTSSKVGEQSTWIHFFAQGEQVTRNINEVHNVRCVRTF